MPRRSLRAEAAGVVVAALLSAATTAPVHADVSGGVDARALLGVDGRMGGAMLVDAWGLDGRVRVGGALGLGALSGRGDKSSRVVSPLAFSLALVPPSHASGFVAVARLGGYVGGEKGGFIGGGFGSCAVGYAQSLGEGATLRMTADVWGLLGRHGGVFLGPALGLGF